MSYDIGEARGVGHRAHQDVRRPCLKLKTCHTCAPTHISADTLHLELRTSKDRARDLVAGMRAELADLVDERLQGRVDRQVEQVSCGS